MKLMKMTDFVLEHKEWRGNILSDACIKYANFLKQPLALDMFIGDKALFTEVLDNLVDLEYYTIEDLIEYDLTLTPHAIKQLGL